MRYIWEKKHTLRSDYEPMGSTIVDNVKDKVDQQSYFYFGHGAVRSLMSTSLQTLPFLLDTSFIS